MTRTIALVVLVLRLMSVWAQDDGIVPPIPILPDEPGIRYDSGGSATQVTIEAFLEPLCSDSRQAFPVLTNLSEHYGSELALVVHFYPLAYHRHSHLATQGVLLVHDLYPAQVWDYLEAVLVNQARWSNLISFNKTENMVIAEMAEVADAVTDVTEQIFIDNVREYRGVTIDTWKYGAARTVAGTPWFFVNGVDITVHPSTHLTFEDWVEFLDPLFDQQRKKSAHRVTM